MTIRYIILLLFSRKYDRIKKEPEIFIDLFMSNQTITHLLRFLSAAVSVLDSYRFLKKGSI